MSVMHFDFMSGVLGYQTNIYVILPDCMQQGEQPQGVLYLLHGGGGNGLDWLRNTNIERYVQPYKMAVIMPETDGNCFYADQKYGYAYFQYLTEEVPGAMEAMLPGLQGVKRYVAGLSMGGYGAFKWAFQKPDFFVAAANLSGISSIVDLFSKNENPLPGVDRVIACNWGSIKELEGSSSDSKQWIREAAEQGIALPKLFAAIGTEDFSYAFAQEYLNYAKEQGIEIHYEEMTGGHDWDVWDEMIRHFLRYAVE